MLDEKDGTRFFVPKEELALSTTADSMTISEDIECGICD